MKIATWNVNGIRARASSFESWLRRSNPDVLCLQEIKAHPDQIPTGIREIDGYSSYWHGAKGGYSGVSIHVRTSSLGESSLTIPHFDEETRVMQVSAGGLTIINVYTPLGQRSYEQKLGFLESLVRYVDVLQADGERIVLCGDLNIAHEDRDIHPEMYEEGMLCTRSEERAKIDALRDMGLVDLFRRHHPGDRQAYSWWPYYGGARARNVGWRIDYIFVPEEIAALSRECRICKEEASSDHSPVIAEIDLDRLTPGAPGDHRSSSRDRSGKEQHHGRPRRRV
jgi:exodeoxyribonuclease-3